MMRTNIGILRGGTSSEYNLSLKTGAAMINALSEDRFDVRDILIDKSGTWHLHGAPSTPAHALTQLDVVLIALHGGIGEDGTVQRMLERAGIPYAGARALPSAIALNKLRAREILRRVGVRMPRGAAFTLEHAIDSGEMARLVFSRFGPPYIVKPPSEGAGNGIRIANTLLELPDAIADTLDAYGTALIEEFIRGEEASVGIIENFRDEEFYALPPAHEVHEGNYITPEHHEAGNLTHFSPSSFSYMQKQTLADLARVAHKILDLSHFSRSDLIVAPHGVYLLEINTIPGLYPGATFPTLLEAVGSSVPEFLEHAIKLARTR